MLEWMISACVLIVMVMLCRKLLKGKISCWVQYSLWLLVAVRLLVPISPLESVMSIANLLPESWTGQETGGMPGGNGVGTARRAQPGQDGIYRQQEMPDMLVPDTTAPAISDPSQFSDGGYSLMEDRGSSGNKADSLWGNSMDGETSESKGWRIIGVAWLTGSCLLALWLLGVNGSFRWRVCRNRRPFEVSRELQRQLQRECVQGPSALGRPGTWLFKGEMPGPGKSPIHRKARKLLPVYVTDQIGTPCMYGLLHPAIYITARTAEDSQVLAMVLCHEQMHYRHGDHVWSVVRMLCLCVHWYNPLVWAAVRLSRQDGELACDEGVLRQLGEKNRKGYGEALLALAMEQKLTLRNSLNLATSMSDTRKQLTERLYALVTMPRMAAGTAVLMFLLTLVLMACTLTGRVYAHEKNPVSDKTAVSKMTLRDDMKTMEIASRGSVRYTASTGSVDSQGMGGENETGAGDGQKAKPGSGTGTGDGNGAEPGSGTGTGDGNGAEPGRGMGADEQGARKGSEAGDSMEPGPDINAPAHNREQEEMAYPDLENAGTVYDNWNVQNLAYYEEDGYLVAAVTEGEITRKLTYVETPWSLPVVEAQFSKEVLYWTCQALLELEQWTGTQVTEVCYSVSELGDFEFSLTPEDMEHSRTFYSRCYNGMSFCGVEVIEHIDYSTDMDVWYSPVKQYVTPPGYDKMTTQERLIWFFERSAIARGSKVEEIIYPWEVQDYLLRTDQGTYYDFAATAGVDTLGKRLYLTGPYDGYPQH